MTINVALTKITTYETGGEPGERRGSKVGARALVLLLAGLIQNIRSEQLSVSRKPARKMF